MLGLTMQLKSIFGNASFSAQRTRIGSFARMTSHVPLELPFCRENFSTILAHFAIYLFSIGNCQNGVTLVFFILKRSENCFNVLARKLLLFRITIYHLFHFLDAFGMNSFLCLYKSALILFNVGISFKNSIFSSSLSSSLVNLDRNSSQILPTGFKGSLATPL